MLRLANKLAATLALLHGSLRVQRTHARGHLVTGASPATSPRGDGYGKQGGGGYGKQTKRGSNRCLYAKPEQLRRGLAVAMVAGVTRRRGHLVRA